MRRYRLRGICFLLPVVFCLTQSYVCNVCKAFAVMSRFSNPKEGQEIISVMTRFAEQPSDLWTVLISKAFCSNAENRQQTLGIINLDLFSYTLQTDKLIFFHFTVGAMAHPFLSKLNRNVVNIIKITGKKKVKLFCNGECAML